MDAQIFVLTQQIDDNFYVTITWECWSCRYINELVSMPLFVALTTEWESIYQSENSCEQCRRFSLLHSTGIPEAIVLTIKSLPQYQVTHHDGFQQHSI